MSKNTFTFKMTMGFWEGELIVKALEKYNPRRKDEKSSKEDLIRHLNYQMTEAREMLEVAK